MHQPGQRTRISQAHWETRYVPRQQALALDRRLLLDQQQRAFQGGHQAPADAAAQGVINTIPRRRPPS